MNQVCCEFTLTLYRQNDLMYMKAVDTIRNHVYCSELIELIPVRILSGSGMLAC